MAQRSQAFYGGKNALSLYEISQGSATLLSGFELEGSATTSVTEATQTITTTNKDAGVKSKPILFPFEGARVIASADFSGATGRYYVGIRFLDATGATVSEAKNDFIASGRRSVTANVPSGAVYMQFFSTREEDTGGASEWSFTRPALRTDSTSFAY